MELEESIVKIRLDSKLGPVEENVAHIRVRVVYGITHIGGVPCIGECIVFRPGRTGNLMFVEGKRRLLIGVNGNRDETEGISANRVRIHLGLLISLTHQR